MIESRFSLTSSFTIVFVILIPTSSDFDVCEFGFHGLGPDNQAQIGIYTPRGSAFLNQSNITAGVWYMVAASDIGVGMKSCTWRGRRSRRFR